MVSMDECFSATWPGYDNSRLQMSKTDIIQTVCLVSTIKQYSPVPDPCLFCCRNGEDPCWLCDTEVKIAT
jgi:hypothetical protein